ncbi:MarR family transcriptional regulator, partial [Escherichia coli]|nr:MarR family transcriptional regulator [Escherichia coli]
PSHVSFVRETIFDSLEPSERTAFESALPKILASLEQQGLKPDEC